MGSSRSPSATRSQRDRTRRFAGLDGGDARRTRGPRRAGTAVLAPPGMDLTGERSVRKAPKVLPLCDPVYVSLSTKPTAGGRLTGGGSIASDADGPAVLL
jgi:hypothetical protein